MEASESLDQTLVLIVDDDLGMRILISEALEQAGFNIIEAENGRSALIAFQKHYPAAVLMDVMMPGMDGFTTCAKLRTLPKAKRTPVLMMTGLDDEESINRAYHVGATDFITKPINYTLLKHRVRYMLRGSIMMNQLASSERRLSNAQRLAQLGHWEWNRKTQKITWSKQVLKILGISRDYATPTLESLLTWIPDSDRERVRNWFLEAIAKGKSMDLNHRIVRSDGSQRYVRQQLEAELDNEGQVVNLYGTLQDITVLQQAESRIHRLAYFDSLTGLPNREFFKDRVEQAIALAKRHQRKGALLFLDLDNFKRINDTLGHNVGDMLLQSISKRLAQSARTSDSILRHKSGIVEDDLARLGGDEFTVLLSEIQHTEDAAAVAKRILETLSKPMHLVGHDVVITPSIGIAVFPKDGDEVISLLKNGDIAMYHAKREGKNSYKFYDKSMHKAALKRLTMEYHLRKALDRNEFSVHYQPQLDMKTGHICGVEALLRWHNAELGEISPNDFIPLAEEIGLIIPIGEWVLRTACTQAKAWRDAGAPIERIAVNVSVMQFAQAGFSDLVAQILQDTRLNPNALELEVTEGLLMNDADKAVEILKTLKNLGIQLTIDDFGTGYSSLSYLKQFPIDRLKIDKAFVNNINTDSDDAAIANAVIGMAGNMGLKVTAEGVENEAQHGFLMANQCDEVQGFNLSPPLSADKMSLFFQDWKGKQEEPIEDLSNTLWIEDKKTHSTK